MIKVKYKGKYIGNVKKDKDGYINAKDVYDLGYDIGIDLKGKENEIIFEYEGVGK